MQKETMEVLVELFYKSYEQSKYCTQAQIEDYDIKTKTFFQSLNKKQHGLFLDVENEYLEYAIKCEKKVIEYVLSLLNDED